MARHEPFDDHELLTTREVADLFGVQPETVRIWGRARRLPRHSTPGGDLRYRRDDVAMLLLTDEATGRRR